MVEEILKAVSQDEDGMSIQTASTVKLKIPESSPETAEENFKVPAGGQHLGAATNSECPSSGVQTEVMDVPPMPSLPSGLCTAHPVDQT